MKNPLRNYLYTLNKLKFLYRFYPLKKADFEAQVGYSQYFQV